MKKLISILIIGIMVFGTGAVSFATGTDQNSMGQNNANQKNRPVIEKMKQAKPENNMMKNRGTTPAALSADFQEMQALRGEIKDNHDALEILRQDIKKSRGDIKDVLTVLKDGRENLSAGQIETLKTVLDSLKSIKIDRKAIHDGAIKREVQNMKGAREGKHFTAAKAAMTNILAEQESRKIELKAINVRLQHILTALESI